MKAFFNRIIDAVTSSHSLREASYRSAASSFRHSESFDMIRQSDLVQGHSESRLPLSANTPISELGGSGHLTKQLSQNNGSAYNVVDGTESVYSSNTNQSPSSQQSQAQFHQQQQQQQQQPYLVQPFQSHDSDSGRLPQLNLASKRLCDAQDLWGEYANIDGLQQVFLKRVDGLQEMLKRFKMLSKAIGAFERGVATNHMMLLEKVGGMVSQVSKSVEKNVPDFVCDALGLRDIVRNYFALADPHFKLSDACKTEVEGAILEIERRLRMRCESIVWFQPEDVKRIEKLRELARQTVDTLKSVESTAYGYPNPLASVNLPTGDPWITEIALQRISVASQREEHSLRRHMLFCLRAIGVIENQTLTEMQELLSMIVLARARQCAEQHDVLLRIHTAVSNYDTKLPYLAHLEQSKLEFPICDPHTANEAINYFINTVSRNPNTGNPMEAIEDIDKRIEITLQKCNKEAYEAACNVHPIDATPRAYLVRAGSLLRPGRVFKSSWKSVWGVITQNGFFHVFESRQALESLGSSASSSALISSGNSNIEEGGSVKAPKPLFSACLTHLDTRVEAVIEGGGRASSRNSTNRVGSGGAFEVSCVDSRGRRSAMMLRATSTSERQAWMESLGMFCVAPVMTEDPSGMRRRESGSFDGSRPPLSRGASAAGALSAITENSEGSIGQIHMTPSLMNMARPSVINLAGSQQNLLLQQANNSGGAYVAMARLNSTSSMIPTAQGMPQMQMQMQSAQQYQAQPRMSHGKGDTRSENYSVGGYSAMTNSTNVTSNTQSSGSNSNPSNPHGDDANGESKWNQLVRRHSSTSAFR